LSQAVNTKLVKSLAAQFGFDYCGIAAAKELTEDARRLEKWLSNGYHGEMQYMENHFDLRVDPRKLVPGAKSVITFLINYFPSQQDQLLQIDSNAKIAKYAWGEDYHEAIRTKLQMMLGEMQKEIGHITGRGFVDSAPVLERSWAQLSGAGWIGKNGNLIRPQTGSFFFLATLIVDIELDYDTPIPKDYCGTCTKCIDACPTEAILPNKTIQANHCISYYTIELKQSEIKANKNYTDWAFGCDICQDVCPWNRFSKSHNEEKFKPLHGLLNMSRDQWLQMEETTFKERFKKSPILRSKLKGLKRNVQYLIDHKEKNNDGK
jgi:epoxyqueuosine reductase